MSDGDWQFAERIMDLRVEEERNRAEARGRAHSAGVPRHAGLSWHGRWLLCELGYRLVALGARLEAYSVSGPIDRSQWDVSASCHGC